MSDPRIEALRTLCRAWRDLPFVLVGATAWNHHIALHWRQTHDLDVTVALALDDLDAARARLPAWTCDPRVPHRWTSPLRAKVDVVPAGPDARPTDPLVWPGSGAVMDRTGLDLAFAHHTLWHLDDGDAVRVATLPSLVVLKATAWLDRPDERERDLADLAYAFEEFLASDDPRRFDDDLFDHGVGYDEAGAWVLGRAVAAIAEAPHRDRLTRFLDAVGDEDRRHHARMRRLGPASWRHDDTALPRRLGAFRRALGV